MSQAPHPRNRLTLADTPNAVGLARLHTAKVLSCWGVPSDIVETVQLLVSELATNAVRHPKEGEEQAPLFSSRNTVQTFEISLEIIGDAVRVSAARAGVAYIRAGWGYGQPTSPIPEIVASPQELLQLLHAVGPSEPFVEGSLV